MFCVDELAKKDFIVFAGAGIPRETGIPDWKSLLKALLTECPIDNIDVDTINPNEYPSIAQRVYDNLKSQNKEDKYYEIIKEQISPRNAPYSTAQLEIVTTTNWIVTTNFDTTFEYAFEKKFEERKINKKLNIQSLPEFKMQNYLNEDSIIYLHGKADERFIIFRRDDYENYYPSVSKKRDGSKDLEDYLKYLYKNYTIVFIGFSFDDFYIKEAFKYIYEETMYSDQIASKKIGYLPRLDKIQHYAFLKKVDFGNNDFLIKNINNFAPESEEYMKAKKLIDQSELIKELESMKIKVILYNEHIEWIQCFQEIRKIRRSFGVI